MVARHFRAAKRSQSLIFSSTELAIIRNGRDVPFQLRYCPALAKKPPAIPKDSNHDDEKAKPDPFNNPPVDLLIAEVPRTDPSHFLVLNKYPVIQNHFILATKASKPQTGLLEPDDLSIAHSCLQAWAQDAPQGEPRRLFAFFNSGEHSGASQAHRHLQFLPVEDMAGESRNDWQLLLDRMTVKAHPQLDLWRDPSLPFLHYATNLNTDMTPNTLHLKYTHLLRAAIFAMKTKSTHVSSSYDDEKIEENGKTTISYNLAMTTDTMAIMSRRSESAQVPTNENSASSVAINGTVLGGTLMVKDKGEWEYLKADPCLLDEVLLTIGHPPIRDETNDNKL